MSWPPINPNATGQKTLADRIVEQIHSALGGLALQGNDRIGCV